MKSLVASHRLPEGANPMVQLARVQSVVLECKPWIEHTLRTTTSTVCKAVYDRYIRVLISAIFCLSVQGRIESIACIRLQDIGAWLKDGFLLSTHFKTAITYGYQVILFFISKRTLSLSLSLSLSHTHTHTHTHSHSLIQISHRPLSAHHTLQVCC